MLELVKIFLKDRKVKDVVAMVRSFLDEIEARYGDVELKEILEGGGKVERK